VAEADRVATDTGSLADYTAAIRQTAAAMESARQQVAGVTLDPLALGEQARLITTDIAAAQEQGVDAFRVAAGVLEDAAGSVRTTAGLYTTREMANRASVKS
jgi:hypothetical protein